MLFVSQIQFWHLCYSLFLDYQRILLGESRGLCSFLKGSTQSFYLIFSDGAPKLLEELDGTFRATWYWGLRPDLLRGFSFVARFLCLSVRYCMAMLLGDYFGPLFPLWKRLQRFWRDCFEIGINVLGSLLPNLWSSRSLMKNVWRAISPSLWRYLFWCFYLPSYSVEE